MKNRQGYVGLRILIILSWMVVSCFSGKCFAAPETANNVLPAYISEHLTDKTELVIEIEFKNWHLVSGAKKILDLFRFDENYPTNQFGEEFKVRENVLEILSSLEKQCDQLQERGIHSVVFFIDRTPRHSLILFPCENVIDETTQYLKENWSQEIWWYGKTTHGVMGLLMTNRMFPDKLVKGKKFEEISRMAMEEHVRRTTNREADVLFRYESCWRAIAGNDLKCVFRVSVPHERIMNFYSLVCFPKSPKMADWIMNVDQKLLGVSIGVDLQADNIYAHAVFRDDESARSALEDTSLNLWCESLMNARNTSLGTLFYDISCLFWHLMEPERNGSIISVDFNKAAKKGYDTYCGSAIKFIRETFGSRSEEVSVEAEAKAAAEADRLAACIAPWTTEQTSFVLHINLEEFPVSDFWNSFWNNMETIFPTWTVRLREKGASVEMFINALERKRRMLIAAGGKDLFILCSITQSNPSVTFLIPLPKKSHSLPELLNCNELQRTILPRIEMLTQNFDYMDSGLQDDTLYFVLMKSRPEEGMTFVQWMKQNAAPRPQFRDGFAFCAEDAVKFVFGMNEDFQANILPSILRVYFPHDSKISNPGTGLIARGMDVAALGISPENSRVRFRITAKSESAAKNFIHAFEIFKQESLAHEDPQKPFRSFVGLRDLFWDNIVLENSGPHMTFRFPAVDNVLSAITENFRVIPTMAGAVMVMKTWVQQFGRSLRFRIKDCARVQDALMAYKREHGTFPPLYSVDKNGNPLHSWRVLILPYLDMKEYSYQDNEDPKKIRLNEPWDSEWNRQFYDSCPWWFSEVYPVVGEGTVFESGKAVTPDMVLDGASKTGLLIFTFSEVKGWEWMNPKSFVKLENLEKSLKDGSTLHSEIGTLLWTNDAYYIGLADGSLRAISLKISPEIMRRIFIRNDAQPLGVVPWIKLNVH